LAEEFFASSFRFFETYYFEKKCPLHKRRAMKRLIAQAMNIKIPKEVPGEWKVVHHWRPNFKYLGFVIRSKNSPGERFRGTIVIDDRIDLSLPYGMACQPGPNPMAEAMRSLMREYDKVENSPWDRLRCDKFFENYDNFV
jgi:hypothetical protein